MDKTTRRDVRRLLNAIEYTRAAVDAELPIQYFAVLLYVAANEETTIMKLGAQAGVSRATASRVVQFLSVQPLRNGLQPLQLVEVTMNPEDSRSKLVSLTDKGEAIVKRMVQMSSPEN